MALRWTDETGREGQSNHVRLALHLEREDGRIFVKHREERLPVELAPDSRSLMTSGYGGDDDPILSLPRFVGHGA